MSHPVAWKNGQVVDYSQLTLHVSDLGVVAGASVTEMARTFGHRPFRIDAHIERLLASCDELGFPVAFERDQLIEAVQAVVAENVRLVPATDDLGIVIFSTAGTNRTYFGLGELPPATTAVHTFRLPLELWKPLAESGIHLVVPERRQISKTSLPVHRKIRNRLHWWMADREAGEKAAGSRALLVNSRGEVTETSNGCFFAEIDGVVVTPADDVLDSMSRRIVEEATKALKVNFHCRKIDVSELSTLQSAFVSSTPFGVLPVASIEGRTLVESDLIGRLAEFWGQITGVNPLQQLVESTSSGT